MVAVDDCIKIWFKDIRVRLNNDAGRRDCSWFKTFHV